MEGKRDRDRKEEEGLQRDALTTSSAFRPSPESVALLMFLPTQTRAQTQLELFQMFELQLQTFLPPQCFSVSDRRA